MALAALFRTALAVATAFAGSTLQRAVAAVVLVEQNVDSATLASAALERTNTFRDACIVGAAGDHGIYDLRAWGALAR